MIHVHFVLLEGTLLLDWAGPAEVLRLANVAQREQGLQDAFAWDFVGPEPECGTSVGARVTGIAPLPEPLAQRGVTHWVVLLGQVGARMNVKTPAARAVLRWLAGLHLEEGETELVCVCAGAVLAAGAGLLAGREATTHHEHLDELREAEPRCRVQANRVFTVDGPVWSSAGVTTGVDLLLHRVSMACGPTVAAQVAQSLVLTLRRGPKDPQLSPFLAARNHLHASVHRVQDAICRDPQADWPLSRMSVIAHTSPRHLGRLFSEHAGTTPLRYLRQIRMAVAEAALYAGQSVTQAAALSGFTSDTQLRRAWRQMDKAGSPSCVKA